MGIFKRMFRRTIAKITPSMGSHQLVLNPGLDAIGHNQLSSSANLRSSKRALGLQRKTKKSRSREAAITEALLLASKNHLPPVQFHHIHGSNAQLSGNRCVARRTQGFCQSLVFSNRVILPNERVYIKVLDISKVWSGTIRFGFTAVDPATLAVRMPKHACPDMTNEGHTWARALADEVVKRNSVIHFSYHKDGRIYYGINNQDCGVFCANVNSNQNLWFIIDIYGKTTAIELIDPRVHNATSPIDFSLLEDELGIGGADRGTMFKSTSTMDDLFGRYRGQSKRKRSRKSLASRRNILLHSEWPLESPLTSAQMGNIRFTHQQLVSQLPNLETMIVPSVQQNIYSPMPTAASSGPASAHDYHQIAVESPYQCQLARPSKLPSSLATANMCRQSTGASTSSPSSDIYHRSSTDEQDISRLLSSIQLSEMNNRSRQHQQVSMSSVKSPLSQSSSMSPAAAKAPVAAARRRPTTSQIVNPMQTNSKRSSSSSSSSDHKDVARLVAHQIGPNKPNSSSASTSARAPKHLVSTVKPKSRHSTTTTTSSSSATLKSSHRDSNNNNKDNPPSKDCPICFERPINCVLYQCGHMCTCYECGVKQWKTQSRTCPICRTIIKDVIKTYMS